MDISGFFYEECTELSDYLLESIDVFAIFELDSLDIEVLLVDDFAVASLFLLLVSVENLGYL